MDKIQRSKMNMFRSVKSLGNGNEDVVASVPAFQTAFDEFKDVIGEIGLTDQNRVAVLAGVATGKKTLKNSLSKKASTIADAVYVLAAKGKDHVLKAKVKIPFRTFLLMKDGELAPFCMTIYNEAAANLDALKHYGVSGESLAGFLNLIDEYQASVPKPRAALVERKVQIANLKTLFKRADEILKERMDKLVNAFAVSNPDFVTRYKNARKITDARTTATRLKGKITNKSNNALIKNVSVTIVELNQTTKTDASGKYLFKPIPKGKYTVKFVHENFADLQIENIEIKQGAINKLDVELMNELL